MNMKIQMLPFLILGTVAGMVFADSTDSTVARNFQYELQCSGKGETNAVTATLIDSPKYGLICVLTDNYDTTQRTPPGPDGNFWMNCQDLGHSIQCSGVWALVNTSTTAIFTQDASGDFSVSFDRSLQGGKLVTLPCKEQTQAESHRV